ncbi:MAG: 4a-hydroxytetrahydrobiopterin dehydratase [Bacteroidota bacterium]|nr:4a-hydroxytetrahydrobiopterin dehydratase [Bacteroidota bacterium]
MSNWNESEQMLKKTFEFKDFNQAMAFMIELVPIIDQADHHPTWTNTYNKVDVVLTTHSKGNKVTEKDRILAKQMDNTFENYNS